MLESDYLAELSDLPQSGIASIESSISLPGAGETYSTNPSAHIDEQSCLYFLACISMRRLLNRVHHLLYAKDAGAALSLTYCQPVVSELSHQLEEWRNVLPPAFAFTVSFECEQTQTEAGGFLRQRYLTCRSVIYRPYLMWALSGQALGTGLPANHEILLKSRECLDACLLHILNLRSFTHTVFADSWICSLS